MHPICLQTAKAKFAYTVELDFSGRQNKRQLDFKRQNENDRFFM